jgi:coenzyme F420-reducing hydrogenase delta subunit
MLKIFLRRDEKIMGKNVKVVVFCCNWSVYPGLQLSMLPEKLENSNVVIVTMCSGRVDPELILEAFSLGAWGVMVAGCPPGECEHNGNYKARKRVFMLKKLLEQFNINPKRLKLEWVSTGESAKLQKMVNSFVEEVAKLGPIREVAAG